MARAVVFNETSPVQVPVSQRPIWICRCGLTNSFPRCDGSHAVARRECPGVIYRYRNATLNVASTVEHSLDGDPSRILTALGFRSLAHRSEIIASDPDEDWKVIRTERDQREFGYVAEIRDSNDQSSEHGFDECLDAIGYHYVFIREEIPVLTMRVNRLHTGPIECADFYPPELCETYPWHIGSASGFLRNAVTKCRVAESTAFVLAVRYDQVSAGMLVDVVNVHEPMVPFYRRLGYELLHHSYFVHPRLQTDSYVMVLFAAEAFLPTSLSDSLKSANLALVAQMRSCVPRCRCSGDPRATTTGADTERWHCPST